jgi:alpha-glucosidase
MKRLFAASMAFCLALCSFAQSGAFHPVASPEAQVVCGKARFTVLTPRLVRMEWAADSQFEDRATLGIVNRNLQVPEFEVKKSKSKVVIRTSDMTLTYSGQDKFSAENLSVAFRMDDPKAKKGVRTVVWTPGADESGNLLSTARTLDKCDGTKTLEPYDKGVLSRDGWAVIDESDRHVFVPVDSDWKYWVECRPEGDRQDLYFFGYGHDYTDALADFTKVSGKIPLPPKYTFGYWWCRYWQYSDYEFIDLANHFRDYNIPMDVMIIDMDWHDTWTEIARATPPHEGSNGRTGRDEFGQGIGWSGYTWKKDLFPDPDNFLAELRRRDIKSSLNLHFNNGIQPYEEPYERFVKDYLSRTDDYDGPKGYVYDAPFQFKGNSYMTGKAGDKAPVPFRICQREWADAFFNSVIRPFDNQGVDFWWLDWQQWLDSKYTKGLSNTFWLNYTFFNDKVRQTESLGKSAPRPMIYHRWGGIGSHRYQVGFSGDTYATWQVLSYLPYFTATASNAGYGYWGHDIGGHMQPKGVKKTDPELYTRWIQSGVFTPIFKTHSTKDMTMEKRFWVFPDHFDAMRNAIRLRYDLTPYIYTAARQAYDTGISITRPLYYYWPEEDKAYTWKEEFMFGDDILATTVCKPVDKVTGLAERTMWFPEGTDWYDMATGVMYKGGSEHTLLYTIDENPYYVKAGAVIPMAGQKIMTLQRQSPELRLVVVPGLGESSTKVYEDDGATQAYDTEYAITEVTKITTDNKVVVKVAPRKGAFDGMLPCRKVSVTLDGFYAPSKVTVNGSEVPYDRFASYEQEEGAQVWGYDGRQLQTNIWVEETPAEKELEIVISFDGLESVVAPSGSKGLINRFTIMTPETKLSFFALKIRDFQLPSEFTSVAQCGSFITEKPFDAPVFIKAMDTKAMIENINSWEKLSPEFKAKVAAQTVFAR